MGQHEIFFFLLNHWSYFAQTLESGCLDDEPSRKHVQHMKIYEHGAYLYYDVRDQV